MNDLKELKDYFAELTRLSGISALLGWDQQVYMPKGSISGRAEQSALINGMIHEKLVSKKAITLIKEAEKLSQLNLIDSALLREVKREHDKAVKIPKKLIIELSKTASYGHQAWEKAREKCDFLIFKPCLEKMVDLQREIAKRLDIGPDLYSTLIDRYEPGATYESIRKIFETLKPKLVNILKKVETSDDKPSQSILRKHYDASKQWELSIEIIKKLHFNFNIGRQDKSAHPFTTSLSPVDVRITTRIWDNFLPACLFGTIHECGHALYEMGFKPEIHDSFLADGASLGIHESQSRIWENIVGRSKEFWTYWFPIIQKYFPENLNNYSLEEFYRSINTVQPSLIRVEADEVTYGLHVILRFELEHELIEGRVHVSELPQLWNEKMEELLGIIPTDDAQGVLQDVHWSGGAFGYFPTYTLGNLYASQIYASALKENPNLSGEFEKGNFSVFLEYLRENIHQHGRIYTPSELIKRITGEGLNPDYFIDYLEGKFYPIYNLI